MAGVSRVLVAAALGLGVVVLLGIGISAYHALQPTPVLPSSRGGSGCSPEPCVKVDTGTFEADVRVASPDTGGQVLKLDVTFRNHSNDPVTANGNHERADLADFSMIHGAGQEERPEFSAPSCEHWPSYEIPQFQTYGPKSVCFAVGGNIRGPFTLRWNPDLGLLSHPYDLALP